MEAVNEVITGIDWGGFFVVFGTEGKADLHF